LDWLRLQMLPAYGSLLAVRVLRQLLLILILLLILLRLLLLVGVNLILESS